MSEPATPRDGVAASLPSVFARGMAMGVAEVIPGVSGGTIAFITGIYGRLVQSLASFSHRSPALLFNSGLRAFMREHDIVFLLVLGAGMATSFVVVANLIQGLLASHGVYVFGFFFGLIVGSIPHVGAEVRWRWLLSVGVAGLLAGVAIGVWFEPRAAGEAAAWAFFGAGALAATAWILPGVSGSFVLLLLGFYTPLLNALHDVDWTTLAVFASGLAVGLLIFTKLLARLLTLAREQILALLTGFLAGSLTQIWPWRRATSTEEPLLLGVLAAMVAGALVVGVLVLLAGRSGAGDSIGSADSESTRSGDDEAHRADE